MVKLVPISYEIWPFDGVYILKNIERAGRTCYKSDDKITDNSYIDFIKKILKNGHESVLEHEKITVTFFIDRGVSHEVVRHRIASYSQECISGDTLLNKRLSIKKLYNSRTRDKGLIIKSVGYDRVIPNWISQVFYKGKGVVYEVKTSLGYSIKATLNHRFMNSDGDFVRLDSLRSGDSIMVNGRPTLLKINDDVLREEYIINKLTPTDIANKYSCPSTSVYRRLHKLNIFENHLNDDNKEKYQKNHNQESVSKMKTKILEQYENGRVAWNKDIKEVDNNSVKKQADNLRKNHHNNSFESENSVWKGGVSPSYYYRIKSDIKECELCKRSYDLHIHHIDRDRKNNNIDNLIKVCRRCHSVLHNGWFVGMIPHPDKIISITEIGEEDVYDLEMEEPFHNYVANGFVVHNSTRYCNYSKDKFGKEITVIDIAEHMNNEQYSIWLEAMKKAESAYFDLISSGCTPQIARSVLPNSLKTEITVTFNIREWRHFFGLRTSNTAHPQMRELTIPLLRDMQKKIPLVFDE